LCNSLEHRRRYFTKRARRPRLALQQAVSTADDRGRLEPGRIAPKVTYDRVKLDLPLTQAHIRR
jgi:hypothetical protein